MILIPEESDREKKNEKNEDCSLRPGQKYLGPVQWNAVDDSLLGVTPKPFAWSSGAFEPIRRSWNYRNPTEGEPLGSKLDVGRLVGLIEVAPAKESEGWPSACESLFLCLFAKLDALGHRVPLHAGPEIALLEFIRQHLLSLLGEPALAPQVQKLSVSESFVILFKCTGIWHGIA
jgi:hypothetical protein